MSLGSGVLEISEKGYGFLRVEKESFRPNNKDIFVSPELIRKKKLREGIEIEGPVKAGSKNRGLQLVRPEKINGKNFEQYHELIHFDHLTSINPDQKITFETIPDRYTTRSVDLLCPIGKGQRCLIVAPPRTGKTVLLQHLAQGIIKNHPEMILYVLLIDERPEEVTDFRRNIKGKVYASTSDKDVKSHVRLANLVSEKAKRLVEYGEDVVILLDSITRLGRAFNNYVGSSGKTMSGGLDARAMEKPKKIFGAARKAEESGSLTIIGTALVDTGSRMDEYIFQEFKGTGNMELVLNRKMAERRIWPAMEISASGTRREELLFDPKELESVNLLRKQLSDLDPNEAMLMLHKLFEKYPTNKNLLANLGS